MVDAGYGEMAGRLWALWIVGAPVAVLFGSAGLPVALVPLLALIAGLGPLIALRCLRGRRDRLIDQQLPDALDAMARSLRSGASLRQAVGEATDRAIEPLAGDLRSIVARVDRGVTVVEAIEVWAEGRQGSAPVRMAASALALAADLGGSGARTVDRVSRSLRERSGVQRELRALSSQARLSALVIIVAPAVFGLAGLAVDGATARFLLSSPAGWGCLAGGALLDGLGAVWMHRVVGGVAT